jgi:dephospho-CoA kinase
MENCYFGLTGGVASGKSTVAEMFRALGARIINADEIGHEMIAAGQQAHQELVARFGKEIVAADGEIDRRLLGNLVFDDPEKLAALNALVHPLIIRRVEELSERLHADEPERLILVDAALIFESGIGGRFKKVLVTWCRPEQQLARLIEKTDLPLAAARRRIASQLPAEEKCRRADFLIDCSASLEETRRQVEALYPKLQAVMARG